MIICCCFQVPHERILLHSEIDFRCIWILVLFLTNARFSSSYPWSKRVFCSSVSNQYLSLAKSSLQWKNPSPLWTYQQIIAIQYVEIVFEVVRLYQLNHYQVLEYKTRFRTRTEKWRNSAISGSWAVMSLLEDIAKWKRFSNFHINLHPLQLMVLWLTHLVILWDYYGMAFDGICRG